LTFFSPIVLKKLFLLFYNKKHIWEIVFEKVVLKAMK